jgi:hypothetical protein
VTHEFIEYPQNSASLRKIEKAAGVRSQLASILIGVPLAGAAIMFIGSMFAIFFGFFIKHESSATLEPHFVAFFISLAVLLVIGTALETMVESFIYLGVGSKNREIDVPAYEWVESACEQIPALYSVAQPLLAKHFILTERDLVSIIRAYQDLLFAPDSDEVKKKREALIERLRSKTD